MYLLHERNRSQSFYREFLSSIVGNLLRCYVGALLSDLTLTRTCTSIKNFVTVCLYVGIPSDKKPSVTYKKGRQKLSALRKGYSKICTAKTFFRPPKLGAKSPPMMS